MPAPPSTDRRQETDRRAGGDRRRGADNRFAVIEVGDTHLRLAVVVGAGQVDRPILVTRTLAWRESAPSPVSSFDPAELAAAFKTLTVEERLTGADALVLLGPRLCVTRTATGTGVEVDRQVKELEDRGQLYLALGGGDVCVAKSFQAVDARHQHAMVSMASQRVIDAVAEAAHQAGLNLRRVESSSSALCQAHHAMHQDDDAPALLVTVEPGGVSVAASSEGRLLLEYLPGGGATPEQAHEVLQQHLGRFERTCQRAQSDPSRQITRVYLAGPADAVAAAKRGLRKMDHLSVAPLLRTPEDRLELRGEPATDDQCAALGGVLQKLAADRLDDPPNLLENWIRESRKHLRPILLRSAAPIAAVLLIAAVMFGLNSAASMKIAKLAEEVARTEPVKVRHRDLRLKLTSAEAKLKSLGTLDQTLPKTQLDEVVRRVGHCLPSDVWLDRLSIADQSEATIAGSGFTESSVFEFVGHIESMPGADNASLQETGVRQSPDGPVTSFNMSVDFTLGSGGETAQEDNGE